ncbi:MAG: helix-turn-helix transcriptional regulator [Akkermansiaceae bacterium]|nr:helix-turn-helix transcriptional regulator [Armatimonadota bacterium]
MRSAREYLDARFDRNVALEELADIAGLTPVYLCRVFQQEVGLPPHAYQIQRRVMHAKRLLLRGVPPGEVAIAVGFFDQSHFGRYFKRITGVTPNRYFSGEG